MENVHAPYQRVVLGCSTEPPGGGGTAAMSEAGGVPLGKDISLSEDPKRVRFWLIHVQYHARVEKTPGVQSTP
jgi:hypothetical protein